MTKVVLTAAAREDLHEIKNYISDVLKNPEASRGVLKRITEQLRTLECFPKSGTLVLVDAAPVSYRYLICGSYMAFYHLQQDKAIIDRVLYGRRDYMPLLFGDVLDEEI